VRSVELLQPLVTNQLILSLTEAGDEHGGNVNTAATPNHSGTLGTAA
jgi:hypothetical protein